jgi:hypothetical protein
MYAALQDMKLRFLSASLFILVFAGLVLTSCEPTPVETFPTATLFVSSTRPPPTEEPIHPIVGSISTPTPKPLTPTATLTPTLEPTPTATLLSTQSPTLMVNCVLDAVFVDDVTIPDDAVIGAGAAFTKTWRVQNTGTCDWSGNVFLVFQQGTPMTEKAKIPVPPTKAGDTVDISVNMTAPTVAGTHFGIWQLQSADGKLFGVQPYLRIVVQSYQVPSTISGISSHSREIFLAGNQMGNQAGVFAKVGDSLTDEQHFLYQIGYGQYILHDYSDLEPVILYFQATATRTGNSFNEDSVAARGSWNSSSPLDPANSIAFTICGSDSPIVCEYKLQRPAVSIIMIGTNEAEDRLASGEYRQNLVRMVETSIDMGVIPVLSTIPWNKFRDPQPYNAVIYGVARSYDIPVMDYCVLMEAAPNHGIGEDGVHPSVPPDGNTADFSPENLKYGYTIRNLLTLQMLDALWRQVLY